MQRRRRFKQAPLKDRLASFAKEASEKASKLPPGPERDSLLKKARQAENASQLDDWAKGCAQHATYDISSLLEKRGQP